MTKPFPWDIAAAAMLTACAILGLSALAIVEYRRANAMELRFQIERRERQILVRCHYWALEGYAIANPNDCLTFDPKAWLNRPLPGGGKTR